MARDVIQSLEVKELVAKDVTLQSSGTLTVNSGTTITRTGEVLSIPLISGFTGASAGYVGINTGEVSLPASTGASTWVVPVILPMGYIITAYKLTGQLESGGNANVLDCDMRVSTGVEAGNTDASLGAITQLSKTADYLVAESKTLAAAHTMITNRHVYVLLTGTTLAATDQKLMSLEVTYTTA